jgi:hypothetical protein
MWRLGLVAIICMCSCQPKPEANTPEVSNEPFVSKANDSSPKPALQSGDEAEVVIGAMEEFFSSRWVQWNTGDFVGLEPAWTTSQFDSTYFDKALQFWTVKFGNDSNPSEETLKRIRETLDANASPPAVANRVEKGLQTLNLGQRIVLAPTTFFDQTAPWVPGAVQIKSPSGAMGSIRSYGAISYPLFSGDHHFAFLQMNRVKTGNDSSQLHFFMEQLDGKWKTLAVGQISE